MEHASALEASLYLLQFPAQAKLIRSRPLPDGIDVLLRIAALDEETVKKSSEWLGRSPDTIREAATFFIEQILFCPEADSYRVLGASPAASNGDLRRNMALLLRWLHPDLDPKGDRSVFARRITLAWNDVKSEERRAAYDRARRLSSASQVSTSKKKRSQPKTLKATSEPGIGFSPSRYRLQHRGPDSFLRRLMQSLIDRFAL
jgi:hypothetical protein